MPYLIYQQILEALPAKCQNISRLCVFRAIPTASFLVQAIISCLHNCIRFWISSPFLPLAPCNLVLTLQPPRLLLKCKASVSLVSLALGEASCHVAMTLRQPLRRTMWWEEKRPTDTHGSESSWKQVLPSQASLLTTSISATIPTITAWQALSQNLSAQLFLNSWTQKLCDNKSLEVICSTAINNEDIFLVTGRWACRQNKYLQIYGDFGTKKWVKVWRTLMRMSTKKNPKCFE